MNENKAVLWKEKPYQAQSCPSVPSYYYLTDPDGHRFFVPASELEDMDGLRAITAWLKAKEAQKLKREEGTIDEAIHSANQRHNIEEGKSPYEPRKPVKDSDPQ